MKNGRIWLAPFHCRLGIILSLLSTAAATSSYNNSFRGLATQFILYFHMIFCVIAWTRISVAPTIAVLAISRCFVALRVWRWLKMIVDSLVAAASYNYDGWCGLVCLSLTGCNYTAERFADVTLGYERCNRMWIWVWTGVRRTYSEEMFSFSFLFFLMKPLCTTYDARIKRVLRVYLIDIRSSANDNSIHYSFDKKMPIKP